MTVREAFNLLLMADDVSVFMDGREYTLFDKESRLQYDDMIMKAMGDYLVDGIIAQECGSFGIEVKMVPATAEVLATAEREAQG